MIARAHLHTTLVAAGLAFWVAEPAAGQVSLSAEGLGAYLQHRVDAGLGIGVEQTSGTAFGGQGMVRIGQWVELSGFGLTGTLNPDSSFAEKRSFSEAEAVASVTAVPWLAVQLGANVRAYEAVLTTQRWITGRVGAELRLKLAGGAFRGQIGGGIMPLTSVDGLADPDLAFYAGAGVVWTFGPVRASARYVLERFDFPAQNGLSRHEQLERLAIGLGFGLGR